MNKKIRWGILGLGNIAKKFASDLKFVEGAELLAVGAGILKKQNHLLKNILHQDHMAAMNNWHQIPDIDVIYIATPHSHHHDNVMLCLDNSKAILCEKAFAVNTASGKRND